MRALFQWTLFPTTFLGALALAAHLEEQGASTFHATWMPIGLGITVLILAEIFLPLTAEWQKPRGDIGTDITHMALTQVGVGKLVKGALVAVLATGVAEASGAMPWAGWLDGIPLWIQVVLAMTVTDLPRYWLHRWSHEIPILWRFHAVHHSPERLYWLNAGRFHPVEKGVHTAVGATVLIALGVSAPVVILHAVFSSIHGMFQHCNIDLRLGPLLWVFPMADLHRWHHSMDLREANANYSHNIAWWDMVFGTRFLPAHARRPLAIGIQGSPVPAGYLGQLLIPLTWPDANHRQPAVAQPERTIPHLPGEETAPPSPLKGQRTGRRRLGPSTPPLRRL